MDYKELVKSMRICTNGGGCAGCIQNSKFSPICVDTLLSQAADAIEDLIAALTASNEVIAEYRKYDSFLAAHGCFKETEPPEEDE